MSLANKFVPKFAKFKFSGQEVGIILTQATFTLRPATKTAGNSIVLTNGYIAIDGVEIKAGGFTLDFANYIENIEGLTKLSAVCMYDELELNGNDTFGLPMLFKAKDIIRKADFQLDLGSGGGVSNSVEFDCNSYTFVS